ncbi:hypothetical protein ES705_07561 [subsurface metagenome]
MSTTITKNRKITSLRVLDPDLPYLASEAAIEYDNLLLGRKSNFKSVYILAERIRNSFEIDRGNGATRSLMDPATLTVLGEAINESQDQPKVNKLADLIKKAFSIADELLKNTNLKDNREELEWARTFCLALSRLAAAYHKSIFDLRPQHPFRRLNKW